MLLRRPPSFGAIATVAPTSSGGASVEAYTEVATLAALQAALANGARLLVTDDIAMGTTDTIDLTSITSITIAIKDGKTVSHSGTTDIFSASSGTCRLTLETGPRSGLAPAFVVTGSGKIAGSSGTLIIDWSRKLHIDGPSGAWTPFGSGVSIDAEASQLVIDAGDGLITVSESGLGGIGSIVFNGGGSSSALRLWCRCGPITFRGTCRGYSSDFTTDYTLFVQRANSQNSVKAGPVLFDMAGATYTPVIYGIGAVEIYGAQSSSASYYPRVALKFGAKIFGGRYFPAFISTAETPGHYIGSIFPGAVFAAAECGEIVSCEFESGVTFTFPADSKPRIRGCDLRGTIVFQSGSKPVVDQANVMGTVTIDSGASGRFTSLQDGSGTFTNNDPLSIVTLSENQLWDTTPHTARYASSVLDPLIGRLVFSYPGTTEGESNRAPHQRASGVIGIESSSGASMDSGYYVSSTTGRFRARINWGAPSRLGWALSFFWRPTSVSFGGAEQNVLSIGDLLGNFIALNQIDNNLRVYVQGVGFFHTSTAGNLFSTSTARLVVITVRINAGSPTLYVRVNGTQVIAAAGAPLLPYALTDLILGANGADARAGRFTKIEAWDIGLSNTQMDELLTKSLLSGMAA